MEINWDGIKKQMATTGPDGSPLSAITGNETDAQLRELILEFVQNCPAELSHPHCPFRMLNTLSRDSFRNLVEGMSRETMVFLFDTECECRNQARHNGVGCARKN
jgi:hypothetical protein